MICAYYWRLHAYSWRALHFAPNRCLSIGDLQRAVLELQDDQRFGTELRLLCAVRHYEPKGALNGEEEEQRRHSSPADVEAYLLQVPCPATQAAPFCARQQLLAPPWLLRASCAAPVRSSLPLAPRPFARPG